MPDEQLYAYYDCLFLRFKGSVGDITLVEYNEKAGPIPVPTTDVLKVGTLDELVEFKKSMK